MCQTVHSLVQHLPFLLAPLRLRLSCRRRLRPILLHRLGLGCRTLSATPASTGCRRLLLLLASCCGGLARFGALFHNHAQPNLQTATQPSDNEGRRSDVHMQNASAARARAAQPTAGLAAIPCTCTAPLPVQCNNMHAHRRMRAGGCLGRGPPAAPAGTAHHPGTSASRLHKGQGSKRTGGGNPACPALQLQGCATTHGNIGATCLAAADALLPLPTRTGSLPGDAARSTCPASAAHLGCG